VKILIWPNSYRPQIGGVEVFLAELAPALIERGHEVSVLTDLRGPDPEHEIIDGAEVRRLPFTRALAAESPAELIRTSRQAAEAVREIAPDVVHLHFFDAGVFFYLRAAAAHPAPMALSFHLSPPPYLRERRDGALRKVMLAAGRITACSQPILDDALYVVPDVADRASVLPHGLAIPDLDAGAPPPDPVVFAAGRLVEEKGFDVLIDALPALREAVPGARVVIVGDGPERPVLAARARVAGVGDAVALPGWVAPQEMYGEIAAAPVTSVPSRWREPFCLVALQAAMMGRPAVASRVGGLPEVVIDGETGVLVDRDDPPALAEELAALLRDRGRTEQLGRAARSRAVRDFSIGRCAERYEALFEELLS
jgi:glycosyltransferase involved in cell wall biosynthesis